MFVDVLRIEHFWFWHRCLRCQFSSIHTYLVALKHGPIQHIPESQVVQTDSYTQRHVMVYGSWTSSSMVFMVLSGIEVRIFQLYAEPMPRSLTPIPSNWIYFPSQLYEPMQSACKHVSESAAYVGQSCLGEIFHFNLWFAPSWLLEGRQSKEDYL